MGSSKGVFILFLSISILDSSSKLSGILDAGPLLAGIPDAGREG